MIDKTVRMVLAAALCASLVWMLQAQKAPAPASAVPSTKNGEWPMYTADLRGSKYSPLDQIDAANFNKLQVAWTFKTDGLSPRTEAKLEGTPIMVKGVLYTTGGTKRAVDSAVQSRYQSTCRIGQTAAASNASFM